MESEERKNRVREKTNHFCCSAGNERQWSLCREETRPGFYTELHEAIISIAGGARGVRYIGALESAVS